MQAFGMQQVQPVQPPPPPHLNLQHFQSTPWQTANDPMHAMHEMYNMHDGTIIGYQKTLQQDGTPIQQNKTPVYCARCGIETTYSVYHKTASTDAPTYICMHHAGNCMNSCNTCNAPALPINTAMNNPSEMNLTTWGEACTRNHMAQSHYHTCSKMITRMADNLLVLPVCHSINYHMQCMHAMCPSRMVFVQNRPKMLTTLTACDWPSNPNEAMAAILHEMPSRIPQHTQCQHKLQRQHHHPCPTTHRPVD